ncbi:MAG TPA: hypothetical protein VEI97_09385, partial [bacterium]|nr:hypothetical protein [bacterium]
MSSPRPRVLAAGLTFGLLVAGCAGTDTTPVGPSDTAALASPKPGVAVMRGGNVQSVLGLYTIRVEAGAAGASVEPLALRTGAANDDLYLLPIDRFLKPTSLAVTAVSWTPTTVDLAWAFTHPFPAPIDPAAAPNGSTNRADLGIAGALVILQDVESAVGNTFFSDRIANTSLVVNPDAYLSPETMVASTTVANTFPYQTLVDETGEGSRVFTSNGGDPMGNFGSDGWTRDELGGTYDQWSGYGVLHQGQISRRTLSLNRAALAAGEVLTFDVAVLAKYNDPRGGSTSRERRANRLPPATPDHTRFAYRMPHGALDVERVRFLGESGGFIANQPTTSTLAFRVDDWDARATESTFSDLADEPEVTAVAPGEAGLPDLAVSLPGVLGDHTTVVDWDPAADLVDDDSAYGGDAEPDSGRPGDGLVYVRTLAKPAGAGETGGMYVGLVRATDPEVPNITD